MSCSISQRTATEPKILRSTSPSGAEAPLLIDATSAGRPVSAQAPSDPLWGPTITHRPGGERRRVARRRSIPADLSPSDLVAVVDSREQNPLDLQPIRQVVGSLATGHYSLRGLESVIAIERKSLADLLGCIGQERERFHRELLRLLAYPLRALVIEATWPQIERGQWRRKVRAPAALGSMLNWVSMGLPVIMAGNHARAGRYVSRILFVATRRRWREARALLPRG